VLWLERQVVHALMSPDLPQETRAAVEAYVEETLHSMPEHLRLGVGVESLAFGARPHLQHALGRLDDGALRRRIEKMRTSRVDVIRQYVRLLQSLVLFAENEFATTTPAANA
jgi:hypothetical protein